MLHAHVTCLLLLCPSDQSGLVVKVCLTGFESQLDPRIFTVDLFVTHHKILYFSVQLVYITGYRAQSYWTGLLRLSVQSFVFFSLCFTSICIVLLFVHCVILQPLVCFSSTQSSCLYILYWILQLLILVTGTKLLYTINL